MTLLITPIFFKKDYLTNTLFFTPFMPVISLSVLVSSPLFKLFLILIFRNKVLQSVGAAETRDYVLYQREIKMLTMQYHLLQYQISMTRKMRKEKTRIKRRYYAERACPV